MIRETILALLYSLFSGYSATLAGEWPEMRLLSATNRGGWTREDEYPKGVHLKGSWISCPDDQGVYAEQSYEHCVLGKCQWAMHLGPDTEFSLFAGPDPDEHRAHEGPLNLLGNNYRENVDTYRRARTWRIPGLNLWISVVAGGGSWTDCSSWFVLVQQT